MSTITELYIFLEKKRDEEHINKVFSYDAFRQTNALKHV